MNAENFHVSEATIAEQRTIAENELLARPDVDQSTVDAVMSQFGQKAAESAMLTAGEETKLLPEDTTPDLLNDLTVDKSEETGIIQEVVAHKDAVALNNMYRVAEQEGWSNERIAAAEKHLQ